MLDKGTQYTSTFAQYKMHVKYLQVTISTDQKAKMGSIEFTCIKKKRHNLIDGGKNIHKR
jgi:hypothetical protein